MLWHWFGAMVWRNVQRTMLIDIARMWPGVYALTGLTLACSQREKVGGYAACQCYIDLLSCLVPFCVRAMTISLGSCTIHTHIHTYIHTYIPTVLASRSFTTSFVFPSFPVPAKTIETHFRKKLTCGVIRSFNFNMFLTTWKVGWPYLFHNSMLLTLALKCSLDIGVPLWRKKAAYFESISNHPCLCWLNQRVNRFDHS